MAVLFFALYLIGLGMGSRFRLHFNSFGTLITLIYFVLVESLIELYVSIEFSNLLWKSFFYLMLIAVPTGVIAGVSRVRPSRILFGLFLGFLFILPISRPTMTFARSGADLKLRLVPHRFIENISRLPAGPLDVEILSHACNYLPSNERAILIAHLQAIKPPKPDTNPCIRLAQAWNGPHQSERHESINRKPEEWLQEYSNSAPDKRVAILNELRHQKNAALLDQAISNLGGDGDQLIIASVRYLRALSGKYIGNDKPRWEEWKTSRVSQLEAALNFAQRSTPLAQKGFSAIQAVDDFFASNDTGEDFLQIYLRKHFPHSISETDLDMLKVAIADVKGKGAPMEYRRGILFFFLALAETKRIVEGISENADITSGYWNSSQYHFRNAGSVGESMAAELKKIFEQADSNRDKKLDSEELKGIIQSRS